MHQIEESVKDTLSTVTPPNPRNQGEQGSIPSKQIVDEDEPSAQEEESPEKDRLVFKLEDINEK